MFSIKQSHGAVDKNVVYMFFPKKMEFMLSFTNAKEVILVSVTGMLSLTVMLWRRMMVPRILAETLLSTKVTPICRVVWFKK